MKKNNTDRLLTGGLLLMCISNCLLYTSVYMVLGILPVAHAGIASHVFPAFLAGGLLVGPFQAYLADTFRRKHVLLWALAGIVLTMIVATHVSVDWYAWMALAQGACLALAVGAGTTISIDITLSGHRTAGNRLFACCGRVGMAAGVMLGAWLLSRHSFTYVAYVAAACAGLSLLVASWVYVSFRAPIGVSLCSTDRFVLPRAWLPALNVGILAYALGGTGAWLWTHHPQMTPVWIGSLFLFPLTAPFLVRIFVRLSHHCQRATANMTFNLLTDAGFLLGLWIACDWQLCVALLAMSVLLYVLGTLPYYKKYRIR